MYSHDVIPTYMYTVHHTYMYVVHTYMYVDTYIGIRNSYVIKL